MSPKKLFSLPPSAHKVVGKRENMKEIPLSNTLLDFRNDVDTMRTYLTKQTTENEEIKLIGKSFYITIRKF